MENRRAQALRGGNMARAQGGGGGLCDQPGKRRVLQDAATSCSPPPRPCLSPGLFVLLFLPADFCLLLSLRDQHKAALSPSFSRLAQAKLDLLVIGSNSWKRGCALPCMGQRPFVWGQGSRHIVWLQVPGCRWAKGGTGRAGLAGTGSGVPSERQGHFRGRLLQRVYNYLLTGFPVLSDLRAGLHFHHSFRQYQAQSEDSVGARFVSGRFYHPIS